MFFFMVVGFRVVDPDFVFFDAAFMTVIYMPFDIFYKPVAQDQEIWFGFTLNGWWAKATAPLHWLIYGLGAYGFWRMKTWMWPWAAVYAAQVVIAMFVFNLVDKHGRGVLGGLIAAAIFAVPMIALWRAREVFNGA